MYIYIIHYADIKPTLEVMYVTKYEAENIDDMRRHNPIQQSYGYYYKVPNRGCIRFNGFAIGEHNRSRFKMSYITYDVDLHSGNGDENALVYEINLDLLDAFHDANLTSQMTTLHPIGF